MPDVIETSCPYCGEAAEVSVEAQGPATETYVEDCPVCCRPWTVTVWRDEAAIRVELSRDDD
jgi:hypothetical protein